MAATQDIRKQVLAFDIYGTILDTNGLNAVLRSELRLDESKAAQLSLLWRRYQLEYTWRLNSMHIYEPFDAVTENALLHALGEQQIQASEDTVHKIMDAYLSHLPAFDDAIPALQSLSEMSHVKVVVFSNGTKAMVTAALKAASVATFPQGLFLADEVKIYKPAKEVYQGLISKLNADSEDASRKSYTGEDVWLVSGNPFDVAGARNAGLQAFWINRAGNDWVDRATPLKPSQILSGLAELVEVMKREK